MSLADLEKRVQAIEDAEKIRKLHQNYINLMDNLEYEEVLGLFTEDGAVEIRNSEPASTNCNSRETALLLGLNLMSQSN